MMMNGHSLPDRHTAAPRDSGREAQYFRLRSDARIGFDPNLCLGLRHPQTRCRRCTSACSARLLHVEERSVRLDAGCLDCGRCAAECPSRALSVAGFAPPENTAPEGESLFVDCWRVPAAQTPEGGYRVPCLGGLSVSRLLALHADRKSAPVVLLDRGWCGECEAWKASGHPAAAHLREATRLLQSIGVPEAALPRLARDPLPSLLADDARADPLAQAQLSRRGFFGSAAREATFAWSGAAESTSKTATGSVERIRPVERLKRLSLLASSAGVSTAELPGGLFPAIGVGETCADHEVCAGVCPTGALSRYAKDGASGLRFDPRLCIDCGACERACPEQALQMYRESVPGQAQVGRPLTRHLQRTCTECGTLFSARSGAPLCPQCVKRAQLARAGFSLSMSARGAAPRQRA